MPLFAKADEGPGRAFQFGLAHNPITGGDYLTTIKSYSVTPGTSVPEPGMAGLLAVGIAGLVLGRRRRKAAKA